MTTKCYLLDDTPKNRVRIERIASSIPCFVDCSPSSTHPNPIACTIYCREEDVAYVENNIADII